MIGNLALLVIVAIAIPFVVMAGLWLFARAMDHIIPSRKAQLAIWGGGFILCVALTVQDYVEGRAFWWGTAMMTIVWGAGWLLELRRKDRRSTPVEPLQG